MGPNFYVILGVSRDTDLDHIRAAYRQLARRYHPDTLPLPEPHVAGAERERDALREETEAAPMSTLDDFVGGHVPGLFTKGRMASHLKDLHVELILDREEAHRGGLFPLELPVRAICPTCSGTGWQGVVVCKSCGGKLTYQRITISVPPGVSNGTQTRLPLSDLGLPDSDLVVLVSVRA